jgi:hypothetical protein
MSAGDRLTGSGLSPEKQGELKKWILDRGYKFDSFEHRCLNKNFNQALWPASAMGLGSFAAATQVIDKRRAWVPGLAFFLMTFRMRRAQLESELTQDLSKSETILGEKVRELMGLATQSFSSRGTDPADRSGGGSDAGSSPFASAGGTASTADPYSMPPAPPTDAWDKYRRGGAAGSAAPAPDDAPGAPAASSSWWDGDGAKEKVGLAQPQTFEPTGFGGSPETQPGGAAAPTAGAWDRIRIQDEEKQKRLAEGGR